jgi:hypothetical protein
MLKNTPTHNTLQVMTRRNSWLVFHICRKLGDKVRNTSEIYIKFHKPYQLDDYKMVKIIASYLLDKFLRGRKEGTVRQKRHQL